MDNQVVIFDTTLRDGEQALNASLSVHEKLQIALAIERLGVDVMEVGFPVSSPGDFESVQKIAQTVKNSRVCALARAVEGDIQACADALKVADQFRIHTFISTSDVHVQQKLKKTLLMLKPWQFMQLSSHVDLRMTLSFLVKTRVVPLSIIYVVWWKMR